MQFKKYKPNSFVLIIIIITTLIFFLKISLGDKFTESFMLVSKDITKRPWIMITYMFLHGSFSHLFYNMYGLLIFGPLLEQKVGPKRFLFVYFFSGIAAALLSSFFYKYSLGASGALMGVIGTLIILMPNLGLLLFFFIPMPLWIAGIIWFFIDLFGVFFPSGVGNIAHIVGLACGLAYGLYLKKQKREFTKKFSSKTHLGQEDVDEYFKSGRI